MRITVSKKSTINVGNYSNIQPGIELTIDNVKTEHYTKIYEILSELVSCLYGMEMVDLVNESALFGTLTNNRIREIIESTNKEELIKNINMRVKDLLNLGYVV